MKRPARFIVLGAILSVWTAYVFMKAAPTWLPTTTFIRNLVDSVAKTNSGDAGPLYALVHHSEMLGKVAVLAIAQACAGVIALAWLAPGVGGGWLARWGAGFVFSGLAVLGWGLAGLLFPVTAVLVPLVTSLFVLVPHLVKARNMQPARRKENAGGGERDPWAVAVAVVASLAVLMMAALAVVPDTSWDAVVYHLRLPAFFVQEHRIFHVPTNQFSSFPLGTEMLGAWFMLWGGLERMGGGQAAKLYHLSCAVVAALCARRATMLVAREKQWSDSAPFLGNLAAALVLLAPLTGTMAVRAYNDWVQAAFAGLVLVAVLERGRGSALLAAVLCAGAFSAKYTAVFILAPLAVLVFRLNWRPYAVALAGLVPWLAKNYLLTGDPVAPFFTGWFHIPAETAQILSAYSGSVSAMSLNFAQLGALLSVMMNESSGEMLGELLMVLPLLLLLSPLRGTAGKRAVYFLLVLTAVWYLLVPSVRFYAVGVPALAVTAALGFGALEASLASWVRWPLAVVLLLNLIRLPLAHVGLFGPLPFILGRESVEHYLTRSLYPGPYYEPLALEANTRLPANARLLVMIDIKAHYIWRRVYHDFQYIQPGLFLRWLREAGSVDGLLARMKREGASHVLVVYQRTRDVGRHYSWQGAELAEAAEFFAAHTRPVANTGAVEVLEVSRRALPRRNIDIYNWMLFVHPENLMLEKDYAGADSLLRETIRRAPWFKATTSYLGMSLARQGRVKEAMPLLEAAVRGGGNTAPGASFAIGQLRQKGGDQAGAERAVREAIRLNPNFVEARYELGRMLALRARYAEALTEFREVLRREPGSRNAASAAMELEKRLGLR
jgi:tetratricopeptide (TPR) repeat protein